MSIAALTFEVAVPQCGNIQEMTSKKIKSNMQENWKCLIKIIETIQFLGRQGLALGGYASDKNSNFMELLKFRSKDFLKLKEWLENEIFNIDKDFLQFYELEWHYYQEWHYYFSLKWCFATNPNFTG